MANWGEGEGGKIYTLPEFFFSFFLIERKILNNETPPPPLRCWGGGERYWENLGREREKGKSKGGKKRVGKGGGTYYVN